MQLLLIEQHGRGSRTDAGLGRGSYGKSLGWVKEAAEDTPGTNQDYAPGYGHRRGCPGPQRAGVDGVTASNSVVPALIGVDVGNDGTRPSVWGDGAYSGMTGMAIKPLTLRTIAEIARNVEITISGNGERIRGVMPSRADGGWSFECSVLLRCQCTMGLESFAT